MYKLFLFFGLTLLSFFSFAQTTYTMGSSSNWSTAASWTLTTGPATSSPPNSSSTSAIVNGVTATVNGNYSVNNLTLNMNSTLNISVGGTLTVYGNLTIAANINGINLNGGTLIVKGNVIIEGNFNLSAGNAATSTGYFEADGNFTTCTDGTITCPSPPTYNVSVATNYTNSGTLSNPGKVVFKGSVDLPGNGSNINGSAGTVHISGSCIPAGSSSNQTFCYKGNQSHTLPITLSNFYSTLDNNNIILNWSTATEINFDYFSLQKSVDGTLFNEIAQVKGHGTTNEKHDYELEDDFPLIGKNYYRLTSVDFDNHQETFHVIVQEYKGEKDFQVSPNPSDGLSVTLTFNFDESNGQLSIYDNIGSTVAVYGVSESGLVSFENPLKSGIYLAKYTSPSFTKTVRLLVR